MWLEVGCCNSGASWQHVQALLLYDLSNAIKFW
jgi:hypothetical protein